MRSTVRVRAGPPTAIRVYQLAKADVVVSLDADFLGFGPGMVRYTKDFASRRRIGTPTEAMNRLYVVEPIPSVTGGKADHRLPLKARDIHGFAAGLAAAVGAGAASGAAASDEARRWITAVAADLQAHKGRSAVIAGDRQPAAVHALARAMNEALGNVGATVTYGPRLDGAPADGAASIAELAADMNAGRVDVLVILGGNPVFTAPADLNFSEGLKKVGLRVHHGLYFDETAELCQWHIPEAHFLESWADARSFDGTVTFTQPLIAPLYAGRQAIEIVAAMNGEPAAAMDLLKGYWTKAFEGGTTPAWTLQNRAGQPFASAGRALAPRAARRLPHGRIGARGGTCGGGAGSLAPNRRRRQRPGTKPAAAAAVAVSVPVRSRPCPRRFHRRQPALKLFLCPDPNILDGRHINNGWLQEMPKPLSKVTWDNVAYIDAETASTLRIENGDLIDVRYGGKSARVPAWIMPGMARDVVAVHFGYGRRKTGRVGTGVGVDTFGLRTSKAVWFDGGAEIVRTGEHYDLASTQNHFMMEGRHPVRVVDAEDYRAHPKESIAEQGHPSARSRHVALQALRIQGQQVGHVDRPQFLHRLPGLHRGLRVGEQHSRRRQVAGDAQPRDALDPRRHLLRRGSGGARGHLSPAGAVSAVRERAVRGGLPGRGDRAQ